MLIFRLRIPACVQSSFSIHSATCFNMNSVFSLRSIEPKVSTCNSHKMSAAALRSPCSFLMSDRIRVTRALSTSTKICSSVSPYFNALAVAAGTLPSVTVRSVSITDSFVFTSGAFSRNDMTTCTIFVVACFNCPCFFESSSTCSFSKSQSPESLQVVTMATNNLEVEARSDAYRTSFSTKIDRFRLRGFLTCLVCFSSAESFSTAPCRLSWNNPI